MFSRIVTSALFAGAATGLIAAILQFLFVQPVLLNAELYETGAVVQSGAAPEHLHGAGVDLVRNGLSVVFTILIYTGYAFVMVALMAQAEARNARISARAGLVWGLCGFFAVHFAPAFSLAPEVPGSASADLTLRQIWWVGTVVSAAAAVALIGFGRNWAAWGAAVLLLLGPHLIGAPQPESYSGTAPAELASLFAARSLGVGLAAWTTLGLLCATFWAREA